MSRHIAEVVEASTGEFVAQSYNVHGAPPFASLVCTSDGEGALYAVVYQVTTAGMEPGRRAIALGRDESDSTAVYHNNPQLQHLFRTDFRALVIGAEVDGRVVRAVPARPATVHGFVYVCSNDDVRRFTADLGFLPLLMAAPPLSPIEELLGAFLRNAAAARPEPEQRGFLVQAGKELAVLLRGDVRRLSVILERIRP